MKDYIKEFLIPTIVGTFIGVIIAFVFVLYPIFLTGRVNENSQKIDKIEKIVKKLEKNVKFIKNQYKQQKELQKSSIKANKIVSDVKLFIQKINPKISDKEAESLALYFIQASKVQNVPLPVLLAIAWQESHFNQNAISKAGCVGIMQVNLNVWSSQFHLSKELLYSSEYNILAGAYILGYYYNQTGSWEKAYYRYFGISEFGRKYQRLVAEKVKIVESQI